MPAISRVNFRSDWVAISKVIMTITDGKSARMLASAFPDGRSHQSQRSCKENIVTDRDIAGSNFTENVWSHMLCRSTYMEELSVYHELWSDIITEWQRLLTEKIRDFSSWAWVGVLSWAIRNVTVIGRQTVIIIDFSREKAKTTVQFFRTLL